MEKNEPWQIDKDSVYFKILKGWLSERFRAWLIRVGVEHNLLEDELLKRIIETIRKITWETFEILKERAEKERSQEKTKQRKIFQIFKKFRKKINKKLDIPIIIISESPAGDLKALILAIKKNYSPDILCSRLATREKVERFVFVSLHILLEDMAQELSEFSGGLAHFGVTNKYGIAIYDQLIMALLKSNNILRQRFIGFDKDSLLRTVVEEALHYFDIQTGGFIINREIDKERRKMIKGFMNIQEQKRIDKEIEERLGVEQIVEKLVLILKQKGEDLFSLLPLKMESPSE